LDLDRPIKHVIVRVTFSVEKVSEQLAEVCVIWFVVEPQRSAKVQVSCKFAWQGKRKKRTTPTQSEAGGKEAGSVDVCACTVENRDRKSVREKAQRSLKISAQYAVIKAGFLSPLRME
jgi:hypothetical protein